MLGLLYSVMGAGLAVSYVPQAIAAWRERGTAEAISLAAWTFWTVYAAVALLYAVFVLGDAVVVMVNGLSFLGCATTTLIVASKRVRHRRRSDEHAAR